MMPSDAGAFAARLQASQGREFWRTLEEFAGTEEFRRFLADEFPREAAAWGSGSDRREFLALAGAALALAGLAGCSKPPAEKIVPHVRTPEGFTPGKPVYYATSMPVGGYGVGLLVKSAMGRPLKIEGNPDHPASLGATDAAAQASVLSLYDPDRSRAVLKDGRIATWTSLLGAMSAAMAGHRLSRGEGLRILTEETTSPTLRAQIGSLLRELPEARWHAFDPVGRDSERAGLRIAFGEAPEVHVRFDRADVIVSLDADFLAAGPGHVRYAHDFAARRRTGPPNRFYAIESSPSVTGSVADHRWPIRSSDLEGVARALALQGESAPPPWDAVARDLKRHAGSSVVLAGQTQPPSVHALVHGLNHALGNAGRTVIYTEGPGGGPAPLADLARDMEAGRVRTLLILGGNPVYSAPADLEFGTRMAKVPLRIHLGLYEDETARLCHWHIPEAHFLESWSDLRAFDGTASIVQPLIAPLYGGKTAHEVLSALSGQVARSGRDLVRETWAGARPPSDVEAFWQKSVHDGVIAGTSWPERRLTLRDGWKDSAPAARPPGSMEAVFRPDPSIGDGRFANNAWLQELPKPLTKITWENAALVAPATARSLGLSSGDLVELRYRGRTLHAPVWILAGHAEDSVTLPLGYGRTRAGRVGTGLGFNAYALRTSDASGFGEGLEIRPLGRRHPIACTQHHHLMEGRDLVRTGPAPEGREPPSLYPEVRYDAPAWGMVVDLGACTGCNACVTACQAENNVPVVGKGEVLRGREMHWLRVDLYHRGSPGNPEFFHQPVPCMHCENAPCEPVCPVAATSHSREGLNEMVYNRCVGTRYCSNNCPYKVRRFNFFRYADWETPSLQLLHNPDVTVRERGVMEKCTYCVQRISAARIEAGKEGRRIRDGEARTACQSACPSGAIVFGDLHDPASEAARLRKSDLNYPLLGELNTRPRTTYLACVRNPNPEIGDGRSAR
jgi:molybdopterin-containing oxidoreductase family iron-sulfur binding subunit